MGFPEDTFPEGMFPEGMDPSVPPGPPPGPPPESDVTVMPYPYWSTCILKDEEPVALPKGFLQVLTFFTTARGQKLDSTVSDTNLNEPGKLAGIAYDLHEILLTANFPPDAVVELVMASTEYTICRVDCCRPSDRGDGKTYLSYVVDMPGLFPELSVKVSVPGGFPPGTYRVVLIGDVVLPRLGAG